MIYDPISTPLSEIDDINFRWSSRNWINHEFRYEFPELPYFLSPEVICFILHWEYRRFSSLWAGYSKHKSRLETLLKCFESHVISKFRLLKVACYKKSGYSNDVRRRIWVVSWDGHVRSTLDATQMRRLTSFELPNFRYIYATFSSRVWRRDIKCFE